MPTEYTEHAKPPREDHDDATVTDAAYAAATTRLLAQGLRPAFLIRPVVLAEVHRQRQAGAASAVPPPVPVTPPPSVPAPAPSAPDPGPRALPDKAPSLATGNAPLRGAPAPPADPLPPDPAPPRLADVTPADLRDVGRLRALHAQAVACGWVQDSEAERLHVVAAAVHARRVEDDPCRLFAWVLRQQAWAVITDDDDGRAQALLRAAARGLGDRRPPAPAAPPPPPALSAEARFVQRAAQIARQAGWRGEPLLAVKMQDPTWTRQRWDAAQAELTAWQQGQARRQRARRGREPRGEMACPEDGTRGEEDAEA